MFINGVYSIRYIKSVFAAYPQNPKSSTIYIPVDALISKQPGTTNIAFRAFSTHANKDVRNRGTPILPKPM